MTLDGNVNEHELSFRVLRAELSACVPTYEEAPADTVDSSVIYVGKITFLDKS